MRGVPDIQHPTSNIERGTLAAVEMLLDPSPFLRLSACAERGNVRGMKTVAAHFDGKQIVLEEPVKLTAHTKLKVIVAEEGETFSDDDLSRWCLRLSEPAFANVWDNARDAAYDKL
jgi:hypothetical protein